MTRPSPLLRWFALLLPARDREFIVGDLEERFVRDLEDRGRLRAELRYVRDLMLSVMRRRFRRPDHGPQGSPERPRGRGPLLFDELAQDVRLALRQIRRSPTFATLAALTLALALGANGAVFSVLEGVLLRPLPYAEPDRLVAVWDRFLPESGYDLPKATLTAPEALDLQEATRALSSLGIVQASAPIALTDDGAEAREIRAWRASASLLPTLGVEPRLGRWFTADEDVPDGPAVVVITHALWIDRYGGDSRVAGRVVTMGGTPTEVVGVLPAGFDLGFGPEVGAYLPLRLARTDLASGHAYGVIGRLAPGVGMADLDTDLSAVNRGRARSGQSHHDELWALPLKEDRLAGAPEPLWVLAVAVGLVLAVACANLAGLLLARGEGRRSEVALRSALGASRGRVARQLLTESTVLALLGLVAAVPLAWIGTTAVIRLDPTALPRLREVEFGGTGLAVTAIGALIATLVFGLAPALGTIRSAGPALGTPRQSTSGRGGSRLRRSLVTAEVAVSMAVVIVASLLVRSLWERATSNPGFRADDVLAFDLTLSPVRYPDDTTVPVAYEDVLERIGAIPGLTSVGAASAVPFGEHMLWFQFRLEGHATRRDDEPAWAAVTNFVMPGYFATMGIPVEQGRPLTGADRADAPPVGVINQTMAQRFWPGENPVGKRWAYGPEGVGAPWITVVGVVPDQLRSRVGEEALPQVYLSQFQSGQVIRRTARSVTVVARGAVEPMTLAPAIRAIVGDFDPGLPVGNLRLMTDALSSSMARPRLMTYLLGIFAAITLTLAWVGLYGVVSYSVTTRTREIGVRQALGATRARLLGMVLAEGTVPLAVGIVLGTAVAWYATSFLQGLLYRVSPSDPETFVIGALVFLAVGLGATLVPALRAALIAPGEALLLDE